MTKLNEKTMSTFEATMRACQESKSKNKTQKKLIKESNKITEADDIDAGIDDFDEFDDEVVDFDGNPIEGESLPEDTFDDVAVIIDPDLDPEQVTDSIDELQQLIDETPDGEVPTSDEYVGDFTYTCPICGNKFFNDTELAEGSECPVCGETPEAFILMGEVSKIDDTEDKKDEEEPKEDSETKEESTEEEVEEVEEIEESKKVEEGCSDKEDKKEDEEDKTEKKEESAQQLELDSKPVWTPPKRSNKRPKVKTVTKDNALKAERARRRARALRRARRMEQMRKNRRVRPIERRRVENRRRPMRRPISRRRAVESRISRQAGVKRPLNRRRVENRRIENRSRFAKPMNRRTFNRQRQFEQRRPMRRGMRLEEKSFNKLLTNFVTENYKNIDSMEVTKARISKGTLTLECVLNKKDESKVNANIVIENFRFRNGYGRFTCDVDKVFSPKTESNTKNTFIVECKKIDNVVKCTGFRYNFITESKSGTYRVSGLCK